MCNQILGFKQFIEVAEKNILNSLVSENPSYFYEILPFAYVLGATSVWIEKFAYIMFPPSNYMKDMNKPEDVKNFIKNFSATTYPSVINGGIDESNSSGGGAVIIVPVVAVAPAEDMEVAEEALGKFYRTLTINCF